MRKNNARRVKPISFFSNAQPPPNRGRAISTPLSDADILREAELILAAIRDGPRYGCENILLQSRELNGDDEDRVIAALEKISRNKPQ